MKKFTKRLFALTLLLTLVLCIAGCAGSKTDNSAGNNVNQGGDNSGDSNVNLVSYQVICASDYDGSHFNDVFYSLSVLENIKTTIGNDSFEKAEREIVFGRTNREITVKAYEEIERMQKNKEKDSQMAYLLYSDGKSVAIAFEEDRYLTGAAENSAVKAFEETYVNGKTDFEPGEGVVASGYIDYYDYQKELDEQTRESKFNALRVSILSLTGDESLADDIIAASREYYSLFSSDIVSWLANLYEPDIDAATRDEDDPIRGGFYYSNSARNTEGFLPDLESTGQAMTIIHYSGLTSHLGGNSGLPEWFRESLSNFGKSLQDPNGFFYHPQWGKALTDNNQERRARDTSWALSLINLGNKKPTYNIYETKGDGYLIDGTRVDSSGNIIPAAASLTGRLHGSSSEAVSKVLEASTYISPELLTKDAFLNYIKSVANIRTSSYLWGSIVCSRYAEYEQRDKQLAAENADWRVSDTLIKYLNDNQNPENGTWCWQDMSEDRAYYNATNGLLKIGGIYTSFGVEMPYALEACQTAIGAVYSDAKPAHVCEVYNSWFAVSNVLDNLLQCSYDKTQGQAHVREIRRTLLLDAATSITKTKEKLALFARDDGSFSYLEKGSTHYSTGMVVCLPDMVEGDINSTLICAVDTRDRMCKALGIATIPLFYKADYFEFIEILEELEPVIKDEDDSVLEPITFDEYSVGELPNDSDISSKTESGGDTKVIADTREGAEGNIFRYESIGGLNDSIKFMTGNQSPAAGCSVFEAEMCFEEAADGYNIELHMDEQYMMGLHFADGRVHFFECSTQGYTGIVRDFCTSVAIGEWFKFRIEYYNGDHDTVRIKVYINDEVIAVSDNYYDWYNRKLTQGVGTPSKGYAFFEVFAMKAADFVLLMDNVVVGKTRNTYKVTSIEKDLAVNVDAADREEKIYGFDDLDAGKNYPSGFEVIEGSGSVDVVTEDGNNSLLIKNGRSDKTKVDVPATVRTKDANCLVIEADMHFNNAEVGAMMQLGIRQRGYSFLEFAVTGYTFKVVVEDDEKYLVMSECISGTEGARIAGIRIPWADSFKLRIEYYEKEKASLIYIDNTLLGLSSAASASADRYSAGELIISNLTNNVFEVEIDNLKVEKCNIIFDEATKPTVDRVTHSFDSLDGIVTEGNVSTVNGIANIASGGSVTLPLNKRSESSATVLFNALISLSAEGAKARIDFVDKDGNTVLSYEIASLSGYVYVYEVTEKQTYPVPVGKFRASGLTELGIEYYRAKDIVQLSASGICIAESSLQYNDGAESAEISAVKLSALSGSLALDNLVIETVNKFYTEADITSSNTESESDRLTLESSTTANIPSSLTVTLNSGGASAKIDEMMTVSERSKVIIVKTASGGADTLNIAAAEKHGTYKCFVFEADLTVDFAGGGSVYMYFKAGDSGFYRINLNLDSKTKKLHIDDNPGFAPYGTMGNPESAIRAGKWGRVRFEFYNKADGSIAVKIAVNGEFLAEATEPSWKGNVSAITKVELTTSTAANGYFALDNIYFAKGNMVIDEDNAYDPDTDVTPPEEEEETEIVEEFEDFAHSFYVDGQGVAVILSDGKNEYLSIVKENKVDDYIYVPKSGYSPDGANCTVFEAKLRILSDYSSALSFNIIYGRWNGMKKLTFNNDAGSNVLRLSDWRDGASTTLSVADSGAKIGEWFTLRIENYLNRAGETIARVYINGNLVGESANAGVLGSQSSLHHLDSLVVRANNSIIGSIDFDDVYFGAGVKLPAPVNKPIEDFEDEAHGITIDGAGGDTVMTEGEGDNANKYWNNPITETEYVYMPKSAYDPDGANCIAIEARIRINHSASNECGIYFLYGRWDGMQKIVISNPEGAYLKVSDWRSDASSTLNGTTDAKIGEWFDLRIENYENEDGELIARVYVNGDLVGESTNAGVLGSVSEKHHLNSLVIKMANTIKGSVDIDDFYFGYDVMLIPEVKKPVEDFEGPSHGLTIDGTNNAVINEEGENSYYHKPGGTTDYIYVPKGTYPIDDADCTVFEAKLRFNQPQDKVGSFNIFYGRWNGMQKFSFQSYTDSEYVGISDWRDGAQTSFSTSNIGAKVGEWFTLRIENYENEAGELIARVYVNGNLLGESTNTGVLGSASANHHLNNLVIRVNNNIDATNGSLDIDDIYFGVDKMTVMEKKEEKAEILSTPTGAGGTVVIMHDDGNTPATAQLLDTLFEKYGLKGDVALIANRLYTDYDVSGTPNQEVVAAWQALFDTGRWNLTNHSMSHTFWGTSTEDSLTVDEEKLYDEAVASGEVLRNLFPGKRVLTYAIPGISAVSNIHGKSATYERALEVLKEHYIGIRDYEGYAMLEDSIDFTLIDAEVMGGTWTDRTVNEAAGGKVAVIFCHNEPESGLDYFDKVFSTVAAYVEEGKVWNAFFEEMVMYLSEKRSANLVVEESAAKITVKLTDTLDDDIYNMPLTVRVAVPEAWAEVRVSEGDNVAYASAKEVDGKWVVDVSVIPDGDNAVLTPTKYVGDGVKESEYGVTLANGQKLDKNYFPGYVRKAVTFTIDDGDISNDQRFINIVKPAGIAGTFNLINTNATTAANYLMIYEGYEVANHHRLHCLPWVDNVDFSKIEIKDEVFNSATADPKYIYKDANVEGLYYIDFHYIDAGVASPSWHPIAIDETYTKYVDITKTDIESVFGDGSVVGFAYPHGKPSENIKQYLKDAGYLYARRTGLLDDTTGFAMPTDRYEWIYNAYVSNLNSCMAKFDALADDGNLKLFSFGVHSVDFSGKWQELEKFAENYGNRPEDFWYATNREIFEYEDALNALEIYDDRLVNPTDLDLFVTIDDQQTVIYANSTYELK